MNQLSDYIKEYVAFTKDECDLIIEFYENNLDHTRSSEVYSAQNHDNLQSVDRVGRKSTEMSVPLDAPIDDLISSKINQYFAQYHWDIGKMFDDEWEKNQERDVPTNLLQNFVYEDEGYSIVKYDSNDGFFEWHFDRLDDDRKSRQRAFSCLIYLNDNFEEGETDFYWHKIIPEIGKIVFFPSAHQWVHKGRKPKNGCKYIITTWLQQSIKDGKADVPTGADYQDYIKQFQK
jgi:hypothetical protein